MKQTSGEVLMANFRKSINDGDVYVLDKKSGDVVGVNKVAYLGGAEFNEINNVAIVNKAKHDKIANDKHKAEQEALEIRLVALDNEIKTNYANLVSLAKKITNVLKVMYGSVDGDLELLIKELDSEVNK